MIVETHATVMALAAAAFFAFALAGLAILRRQKSLAVRTFLLLLFCYACVWVTLWVARRGQLLVAEAAAMWIVALLLVAVVETLRFWRRKRTIA
jgi:hypothetical protein